MRTYTGKLMTKEGASNLEKLLSKENDHYSPQIFKSANEGDMPTSQQKQETSAFPEEISYLNDLDIETPQFD
jgi:hypothetical protein